MKGRSIIIFFISVLIARGALSGMTAEDRENVILAETLSPCVALVENETNGKYITGTLFSSSGAVIITNYHVLDSSSDVVHVFISTGDEKAARYPCRFVRGSAKVDLALFSVEGSSGIPDIGLSFEAFADNDDLRRGVKLVFLGFPLYYGMTYDAETRQAFKRPVFRTGTIASEIDRHEFLADAMASNGNSGSPVFIRAEGKKGRPGFRLAGIMKQFQHDTIPLKDAFGKWSRIPHNTGLSAVIPAEEVRKFLEQDAGH